MATPNEPPKEINKLERAVQEIITTEKSYIDSLENFQKNFIIPLRTDQKYQKLRGNPDVKRLLELSEKLELILKMSKMLLEDLKKAGENADPHAASKAVSETLSKYTSKIQLLYGEYATSFDEITNLCGILEKNNNYQKLTSEILNDPTFNFKGLSAQSHYIMPIQRVPRYDILLKAVEAREDNLESLNIVSEAWQAIKKVADNINKRTQGAGFFASLRSSNEQNVERAKSVTFSLKKSDSEPKPESEPKSKFNFPDVLKKGNISKIEGILNQKNSLQESGVTKLSCSKPLFSERLEVTAHLSSDKGKSYTFVISDGNGQDKGKNFHITIKEDISKLSPKERNNLFNIAKKIGATVSPIAVGTMVEAGVTEKVEIQFNAKATLYQSNISFFETLQELGCNQDEMYLMSELAEDGHFKKALSDYQRNVKVPIKTIIEGLKYLESIGCTTEQIREIDQQPNNTAIRRSLLEYMKKSADYQLAEHSKGKSSHDYKNFQEAEGQLNIAKNNLTKAVKREYSPQTLPKEQQSVTSSMPAVSTARRETTSATHTPTVSPSTQQTQRQSVTSPIPVSTARRETMSATPTASPSTQQPQPRQAVFFTTTARQFYGMPRMPMKSELSAPKDTPSSTPVRQLASTQKEKLVESPTQRAQASYRAANLEPVKEKSNSSKESPPISPEKTPPRKFTR